jgi:S-adenosylmethionine hydrolase
MKGRDAESGRALPHSNTLARTANLRPIITLTTDFGLKDWFAGTMKGVILGINPQAALVDITHEIRPGELRAGGFALAASCGFFPKGTVHLAVIDPGVGSQRRAIAVETTDYFFVGPDNGLLSLAIGQRKIKAIHLLENKEYFLQDLSRTFHGRDIFAPVAAHLSCGVGIGKLGPRVKDLMRITWPRARRIRNGVEGEVVYLDQFGNAITNIDRDRITGLAKQPIGIYFGGKCVCSFGAYYESVAKGIPIALIGSTGFVEIAVNGGSAAREFGIRAGDAVRLQC